jgi:hypothetical protein
VISSVGHDTYAMTYVRSALQVNAAPTNTDHNNRALFWPAAQHTSRDGEVCAQWKTEDHATQIVPNIQEGLAFRVRNNADGSLDAITLTRNVWFDASWHFNVNLWHVVDTSRPGLTNMLGADLRSQFGNFPNLPWGICGKVMGRTLTFVVWRAGREAKPAYGSKTNGGTVTLPTNYVYRGNFGWYAGHLAKGQSVDFDELKAVLPR